MKKIIAVFILSVFAITANAQTIKLENVKTLKKSKLIIGLTSSDLINKELKEIIASSWKFNEVVEFLPKEEAYEKAKNDASLFVLSLGVTKSVSLNHSKGNPNDRYVPEYRDVSYGVHLEINPGKGKPIVKQFLPSYGKNNTMTKEILTFAIMYVNKTLTSMMENNFKTNGKYMSYRKDHGSELKAKTLYIAEGWLSDKVSKENVKTIYGANVEVVSYEKWQAAILSKEAGIAYSIIVPLPMGGDYVYQHYIVDAETGTLFGIAYPKASASVGGVSVSKSNTAYINEKILKKYALVLEGKW